MAKYDSKGNRVDSYKEDSTVGKSIIIPLNYKGDVLTQAWIDSRVLATLSRWLEQSGFYPTSMSDVARRPLEALFEHLVSTGAVVPIEDTNEARTELQRRYRVSLNRGGRGLKNILHNQMLSTKRQDLAAQVRATDSRYDIPDARKPDRVTDNNRPSQEEIDRLVSIYNNLPNQTKEQALEAAMKSGVIVEDESSIREGASIEELEAHVAKEDAERIAAENDPATLEFLKSNTVKEEG